MIVRTGRLVFTLLPVLCIALIRESVDYPCRYGADMPGKAFSIITGIIYTAQLK